MVNLKKIVRRIIWNGRIIKPAIDRNIALQEKRNGPIPIPRYEFPFEKMKIGDSFKVMYSEMSRQSVSGHTSHYEKSDKNKRKNGSMKAHFTTREGIDLDGQHFTRVWRVSWSRKKGPKYTLIGGNTWPTK